VIRVAIVGCGAVTELGHLPASRWVEGATVVALVDKNLPRARALAKTFGVPRASATTEELGDLADAAIVALPHALHCSVGTALLRRGLHVLVEKPMALTGVECEELIAEAERSGRVLAVGLMRRFASWARLIKSMIETDLLGPVQRLEWIDGAKFSWPAASDAPFRKDLAGGGVFIDTGAHALDAALWWFGPVRRFDYFDDQEGGVEADCDLHLTFESGVTGRFQFSRTRDLGNCIMVRGERAVLEVEPYLSRTRLYLGGQTIRGATTPSDNPADLGEYVTLMHASFQDWIDAIRLGREPAVTGAEARKSVELIEDCYRNRQPLHEPWDLDAASTLVAG
jgi:predicted dehydrogenase